MLSLAGHIALRATQTTVTFIEFAQRERHSREPWAPLPLTEIMPAPSILRVFRLPQSDVL